MKTRLPSLLDRLWASIDKRGPDECWPWTGQRHDHGYGLIRANGKRDRRAHRVLYEQLNGALLPEQVVRHSCDNPPCCNPAHLQAGSQIENMADVVHRGRRARKFSEETLAEIKASTLTYKQIAAEYGISQSYIRLIKKTWVPGMHRSFTF